MGCLMPVGFGVEEEEKAGVWTFGQYPEMSCLLQDDNVGYSVMAYVGTEWVPLEILWNGWVVVPDSEDVTAGETVEDLGWPFGEYPYDESCIEQEEFYEQYEGGRLNYCRDELVGSDCCSNWSDDMSAPALSPMYRWLDDGFYDPLITRGWSDDESDNWEEDDYSGSDWSEDEGVFCIEE